MGREESYKLSVPFITNDPSWIRGFEVGMLYQRMKAGAKEVYGVFHSANDEYLFQLAHIMGYKYIWNRIDSNWIDVKFKKAMARDG